jgi:hypothetical protein
MESSAIKEILYDELRKTSESKIHQEIASENISRLVRQIIEACIPRIPDGNSFEAQGILAESLSHYILTNALIPSQRKITRSGIDIDVVIPDSKTLVSSPKDALVLYFAKTKDDNMVKNYLKKLEELQPVKENILVISKSKLDAYKTYEIGSDFANLFDDVNKFLSSKKPKLRIFKT